MLQEAILKVHRKEAEYFWGADLEGARRMLGLTQEQFANLCDWSQSNQTQLELPEIEHYLDWQKREKFAKLGVKIISA